MVMSLRTCQHGCVSVFFLPLLRIYPTIQSLHFPYLAVSSCAFSSLFPLILIEERADCRSSMSYGWMETTGRIKILGGVGLSWSCRPGALYFRWRCGGREGWEMKRWWMVLVRGVICLSLSDWAPAVAPSLAPHRSARSVSPHPDQMGGRMDGHKKGRTEEETRTRRRGAAVQSRIASWRNNRQKGLIEMIKRRH